MAITKKWTKARRPFLIIRNNYDVKKAKKNTRATFSSVRCFMPIAGLGQLDIKKDFTIVINSEIKLSKESSLANFAQSEFWPSKSN